MKNSSQRGDVAAVVVIWTTPTVVWAGFLYTFIIGSGKSPFSFMPPWLTAVCLTGILASVFLAWYFAMRGLSVKSMKLARWLHVGCAYALSTLLAPFLPVLGYWR